MNEIRLEGFVGKDAETVQLQNGGMIVKFTMATSSSRKDKVSGGWLTDTEWHNIVMFGKLAERYDQHIKKGFLVYVIGKQTSKTYEKKDGTTGYSTAVIANKFGQLVNMPKNELSGNPTKGSALTTSSSSEEDDLPF